MLGLLLMFVFFLLFMIVFYYDRSGHNEFSASSYSPMPSFYVSSGSTIRSSAEGVVNGMELVSTEYLADDGCAVIMRLPRQRLSEAGFNLKENN